MRIPGLKAYRARVLYAAGLDSVAKVAQATKEQAQEALSRYSPFKSHHQLASARARPATGAGAGAAGGDEGAGHTHGHSRSYQRRLEFATGDCARAAWSAAAPLFPTCCSSSRCRLRACSQAADRRRPSAGGAIRPASERKCQQRPPCSPRVRAGACASVGTLNGGSHGHKRRRRGFQSPGSRIALRRWLPT